ncbi:MAG: lipoate--protein ligase family protein [Candidatus Aenigmarchaeota archaeon]|nr:lipoate--protein ligase family protein [Candidatus Aenigmarchaeota archaeon]
MTAEWRVVGLQENTAAMNMALDEAVAEAIAAGKSRPTIRFYRWNPSAVSVGCFQSLEDEISLEACRELGVDFVRRWTGGGAVYHDYHGEITYSVLAPEHMMPRGITESYHMVCGWIVRSLENLEIKAEFKPINDIIVSGKKVSGNAQTRRKGVLIQHGTILYDLDVRKMFTLLKVPKEKISDKMIQNVEERVTCLKKQKELAIGDVYNAMLRGFTENKKWVFGDYSKEEIERARELVREKYGNKEWNFMR